MYPDDCVQSIIATPDQWWQPNDAHELVRGALIYAFIPHVDQTPYGFEPIGRADPTSHSTAKIKVSPLKVDAPLKQTQLPVAAMPLFQGEVWAAYRAKVRPCLVLGFTNHRPVDRRLTKGMPRYVTAPTLVVAPHYGVDKDGTRAGFNKVFVERIRHCEYPGFVWNPIPSANGPRESILRLDQLQPIGAHHHSFRVSEYRLSADALGILDELMQWQIHGGVPEGGHVAAYWEVLASMVDA